MTHHINRWDDGAEQAIEILARAGGVRGLIALAIVSAGIRARDETARQWDNPQTREVGPVDWIPETDWRWIAGLALRHCPPAPPLGSPPSPPPEVAGAYWASYDHARAMVRSGTRPIALMAARRLDMLERRGQV